MKSNIRIIHHLGRSGGTIISRCIGCMQNIILLSEVHPFNAEILRTIPHPLQQAYYWFGLLTTPEMQTIDAAGFITFSQSIDLIFQKSLAQNKVLVLRDWNHIDFIGEPFVEPSYVLNMNQALQEQFNFLEVATVRHPIDQWLSMQNNLILRSIKLKDYLAGYWAFLQVCGPSMLFIHYEHFCQDPQTMMALICQALELDYDQNFIHRWMNYITITGDVENLDKKTQIMLNMYPHNPEILKVFEDNQDYHKIINFLDY